MTNRYVIWIFRFVVAGVLIPAGYLKLIGNPPDIELFVALDMEPHGRVIIGLVEIAAGLLVLTPQAAIGALLAIGVMLGAIIAHSTVLGVDMDGHGPQLIGLLCLVILSSAMVLFARRRELPVVGRTFGPSTDQQS
ncbi:MAG: DoxX family protein [Myxococcota bacterium]